MYCLVKQKNLSINKSEIKWCYYYLKYILVLEINVKVINITLKLYILVPRSKDSTSHATQPLLYFLFISKFSSQ